MLYRNNEQFQLTSEQYEEYSRSMIFKLPKGAYGYNELNKMMDIRNSQAIPTLYVVHEEVVTGQGATKKTIKGRNTIRFATSARPNEENQKFTEYAPLYLEITNTGFMTSEDPEKNYFLANSPHNGSNPKRPKGTEYPVYFEVHEPKKNAAKALEKLTLQAKAQALLVDEKLKMTDQELLPIAFNYFYSDTNHGFLMSPEQMDGESIRVKLFNLTLTNPKRFLDLCNENAMPARDVIAKASAKRIIVFNPDTKEWIFNESSGPELMMKVEDDKGPSEELITMLEDSDKSGFLPRIKKRMLDLQRMVKA